MKQLEEWRLILGECEPHYCMALDEAILYTRAAGLSPNTVRIYVFSKPTVTIGRFQRVNDSVDLDAAERLDVTVIRRITGGGSVLHDPRGEVTYSVVVSEESLPRDIEDSFRMLAGGVIEALRILGLEPEFVPLNDIVVNGKKISGSAQARKLGAVLQHGTLLYNSDLELMERILRAPRIKLEAHGASRISDRVTTVSRETGVPVAESRVIEALVRGFERAFGIKLRPSKPSPLEQALASSLSWRYRSREWLLSR